MAHSTNEVTPVINDNAYNYPHCLAGIKNYSMVRDRNKQKQSIHFVMAVTVSTN